MVSSRLARLVIVSETPVSQFLFHVIIEDTAGGHQIMKSNMFLSHGTSYLIKLPMYKSAQLTYTGVGCQPE